MNVNSVNAAITFESVSNASNSSNTIDQNSNKILPFQNTITNFDIPWHIISFGIMDQLKNGKKLSVFDQKTVCHILVRFIRNKFGDVCTTIFHTVGNKLREKYPQSFGCTLQNGKNILTTKYDPFVNSMINRNNYLKHYKNVDHIILSTAASSSNNNKGISKTAQVFKNATKMWQPKNYPDNENEESLLMKKQWLVNISQKGMLTEDENQQVLTFMDLTYCIQRTFLNNVISPPTLDQIKENWPFLLQKPCLDQHFKFLCQLEHQHFTDNFAINQRKVMLYGQIKSIKKIRKWLILNESLEIDVKFLELISKLFNEDITLLLVVHDGVSFFLNILIMIFSFCRLHYSWKTKHQNNLFRNHIWHHRLFYHLVKFNNVINFFYFYIPIYNFIKIYVVAAGQRCFDVYYKNSKMYSSTESIKSSLEYIMDLYFVFNIKYEKSISQTMEFLQRFFFSIYVESGRGNKNNKSAMQKVTNIIKKIDDLDFNDNA